ncbi:hypothetical protein JRI60_03000 [Archangium violaceum]|uniref:hypothetical protein n=1 Tax=Archangium violaceum TaxID=83451 RepID=UPI00194F3207|nr:hypothetical protein [Archangium violaceum]QRN98058.1 hypothetical protein JRI60_03000 [Archangium violaceum]
MGKSDEGAHGASEEPEEREPTPSGDGRIFDQPATLREPAAPRVPRVMPPSAVAVIPLTREERQRATEAQLTTLQQASEATDALLHEIFEEELLSAPYEPDSARRRSAAAPRKEEDWPAELHSLPLKEE